MRKFIDVGVNLTDKMYKGIYNGKLKHQEDVINVLNRALEAGIEKMLILNGSLSDCYEAMDLTNANEKLLMTVGCHPTNCNELINDSDNYINNLRMLAKDNSRVVAIGECGLDYDRENFCSREVQKPNFVKQIELAVELQLPLYLHCRSAHDDFISILKKFYKKLPENNPGIVHTFDGNLDQAKELTEMGFFLGINGCSLKAESNLEVVKLLPIEKLLIETDAPWCGVRPSHAGYKYIKTFPESNKPERWSAECTVKGRNEPVNLIQIFEILCGIRQEDPDYICSVLYNNSTQFLSRI